MRPVTFQIYHTGETVMPFTLNRGGILRTISHLFNKGAAVTGWGICGIRLRNQALDLDHALNVTEYTDVLTALYWNASGAQSPTLVTGGLSYRLDDRQTLYSNVRYGSGTISDSVVYVTLWLDEFPPEEPLEKEEFPPRRRTRGRERSFNPEAVRTLLGLNPTPGPERRKKPAH